MSMLTMLTTAQLHRFFRAVSAEVKTSVMLGGSAEPSLLNHWVIIGLQARQLITLQGDQLILNGQAETVSSPDILFQRLEAARQRCQTWPDLQVQAGLPLGGGLIGGLGYGFARWCDEGLAHAVVKEEAAWPDLLFVEAQDWLLIDLEQGRLSVLTEQPEREAGFYAIWHQCLAERALEIGVAPEIPEAELAVFRETFAASFSQPAFEQAVDTIKAEIGQGEIYQANLSIRLQKDVPVDPYGLFERLCQRNPSPFSGFLKWPGHVLVCNSPERLIQLDDQGKAQTRPIAGTRGRGQTDAEDGLIGDRLQANPKERAEHLMLVDLARNDVGRVCLAGTVMVDELLVLERYSHVTHLVSNVTGQLNPESTGWDLLRALFPGGTITGCPKLRCMEILDSLEPVPRGFYTGSLGYFDAVSGALDFNILIRSLFLRETGLPLVYNTAVHVGAGIVHDAVGAHEYRECLRKATASLATLYAVTEGLPVSASVAILSPSQHQEGVCHESDR